MSEMTEYKPGTFSWVDLGTTDPQSAKKFYTELFGWTYEDFPAGDENQIYTMLRLQGKDVAALYGTKDEQNPSQWTSYITTNNADEAADKAKSLGGTIMMEPLDVMNAGRMALIQDPGGAHFAVWQPNEHIGTSIVNQPNSLCWNELATKDFDGCKKFYTELFGWESEDQQTDMTNYSNPM